MIMLPHRTYVQYSRLTTMPAAKADASMPQCCTQLKAMHTSRTLAEQVHIAFSAAASEVAAVNQAQLTVTLAKAACDGTADTKAAVLCHYLHRGPGGLEARGVLPSSQSSCSSSRQHHQQQQWQQRSSSSRPSSSSAAAVAAGDAPSSAHSARLPGRAHLGQSERL
jgi:hypothetical protein